MTKSKIKKIVVNLSKKFPKYNPLINFINEFSFNKSFSEKEKNPVKKQENLHEKVTTNFNSDAKNLKDLLG